jgi:hypothetical protein
MLQVSDFASTFPENRAPLFGLMRYRSPSSNRPTTLAV